MLQDIENVGPSGLGKRLIHILQKMFLSIFMGSRESQAVSNWVTHMKFYTVLGAPRKVYILHEKTLRAIWETE